MKSLMYLSLALLLVVSAAYAEQQRILRRVIKSTPTATNLGRIRQVTVRSVESGGVSEISSKEAASFGQRSANETSAPQVSGTKTKAAPASSTSTTTSTTTSPSTTSTTSTTTAAPSSTSAKPTVVDQRKHKASERQQAGPEVELLSGSPSSWQTMTAVEAPAAMLIATGTRAAVSNDLSSSASSHEEASDFLRSSSGTKGGLSRNSIGETFSRIRQQNQQSHQQQQVVRQQNYFRPAPSKTAPIQATKTHWYQTTSTTARPAPLVQQQEQQYEQQSEQYVEQQQQQQVEYGAAPLGQAEPFAFDFKTEDQSGNGQYRKEESDQNGVVRGSYGYTDANGIYRHVEYVADQNGFRANIKSNEPGLIGENQPASIQLASAPAPRQASTPAQYVDQGENWQANSKQTSADLALAPPDFESSHKSERLPRHYRQ